jgi:pilus assembly protein CpaB
MGKYRPYLFLGVAVVVALIATFVVLNYVKQAAKPKEPVVLEKKSIAVAAADIPPGAVLASGMIKQAEFLQTSLPEGYFSDSNALIGRVLIYPLKANEPIFESRLAPITIKTGGVAALISPKKRAVSVRVDKVIGVAGFIHVGNRVDVLVTILPRTTSATQSQVTKIVLENILVLASGQEFETKGKEEKASPVDVITLEVTPQEAEKLALAATEGKLQLALRNFNDTEDVLTRGTTVPTLLDSYTGEGERRETKAGPKKVVTPVRMVQKPTSFTVELIKGGKASEVKVEGRE